MTRPSLHIVRPTPRPTAVTPFRFTPSRNAPTVGERVADLFERYAVALGIGWFVGVASVVVAAFVWTFWL